MKKCLSITLLLLFPVLLHAQHNVTKFLGIPVDGSKWTMIQKLKEKGFVRVPNIEKDVLEGEFNGQEVYVGIAMYKNKVRRIWVKEKTKSSEVQIKLRYNRLIRQFRNNNKYKEFDVVELPESDDLSFDTDVDKRKYQSGFLQAPWDNEMSMRLVYFEIFKQSYGQYFIGIFYDNKFNEAHGEDL